jgi:transposase InsO family protein
MADHLRTEFVLEALDMAPWTREPEQGFVHHSDRGADSRASRSDGAARRLA